MPFSRPSEIVKFPGDLLTLTLAKTGSDYVYLINTVRDDGTLVTQDRRLKSVSIPEALQIRIDMIPDEMYIKYVTVGPDGEWFLQYANLDGTGDKAYWDVRNTLCSDFLQARFRSGDIVDLIVAFGPHLSYVILDGDRGFLMSKNVPDDLRARVMNVRQGNGKIYAISMYPNGGYFIKDSEGVAIVGAPPSLEHDLEKHGVTEVLNIQVATDYSWAVLRRDSFAASGICASLERMFQAHYEHQGLYRKARAAEIKSFDSVQNHLHQKKEKAKADEERRQRVATKKKESTQKERELAAMKKKQLVQRVTIATAKGLKPGFLVTVAGFSKEPGDCTIESVSADGTMTVTRNSKKSKSFVVEDLRSLCMYHLDESPRIETIRLVKATDKFEAAVVGLLCPTCGKKSCTCDSTDNSTQDMSVSSMFSKNSDKTPTNKDFEDATWQVTATRSMNSFPSSPRSWDSPAPRTETGSESPLSTSQSMSRDTVLSILRGEMPIKQNRVDFLPVFESKGERLPYDEHRCAEKIDFERLVRTLKDLKRDRAVRASYIDALTKRNEKGSDKDSKLHAACVRRLKRCHDLELMLEVLHNTLKDYPITEDGYVVHEVEYQHKDEFYRGTLFAVGKNVTFEDSRYPRNTTLQAMHSELWPTLCGAFCHHVEIENCMTRILCSVAHHLGLLHVIPTLVEYRDNYELWVSKLAKFHRITEEAARKWPNIIMMGEHVVYKKWLRSVGSDDFKSDEIKFGFKMAVEVAVLADEILRHPKFWWATADRAKLIEDGMRPAHIQAMMLSRVVQSCQNEVLSQVHRCCHNLGWIARSKVFDSLILEQSRDAKSSLNDTLKMCQTSCIMQGWDLKLVELEMYGKQDNNIKTIHEARVALSQLSKTVQPSVSR
jgi:hypothetical protein